MDRPKQYPEILFVTEDDGFFDAESELEKIAQIGETEVAIYKFDRMAKVVAKPMLE